MQRRQLGGWQPIQCGRDTVLQAKARDGTEVRMAPCLYRPSLSTQGTDWFAGPPRPKEGPIMKCRRLECNCQVEPERQFCSPHCEELHGQSEPCGCNHGECV